MSPPRRIVSLLPSATEIVGELGLAGRLVGVSAECDWPPAVRDVPVVTGSRVDTRALSSRAIDDAVRGAIADGRSLYAVDEDELARLQPDLVLTQDLCRVCAVSTGELRRVPCEVLSLDPHTVDEVLDSVATVAARLGVADAGRTAVEALRARLRDVEAAVAGRRRRPVVVAEWLDPPFAAGHWVPEMVDLAGGRELLGRRGEPSYPTSWEAVAEAGPELVVAAPCGFDAERAAREVRAAVPPLPGVRVVAVDANAYYSRPAPRIVRGVEQLAHLLHPDAVPDPGLPALAPAAVPVSR